MQVKNLKFFGREVYLEPFDQLRTGGAEGLPQNDLMLRVFKYNTYPGQHPGRENRLARL